jgi:transcriptional regulator with XRE-family HTH domain
MAKGLSQAQLARRLGVTFQQVQKYETGGNRIPTSRLVKLAGILGVPIAALFEGTRETKLSRSLLALISDSRSFRLGHAFGDRGQDGASFDRQPGREDRGRGCQTERASKITI